MQSKSNSPQNEKASPSPKRRDERSNAAINALVQRHPWAAPFSERRMTESDFDKRVSPRTKLLGEIPPTPPSKLRHGQRWGDWRLDAHRLTLDFAPNGVWRYELDLEPRHDAASILDFIFQFHGKVWATPQVMHDLLDALHDVFGPQAHLCSLGTNKQIPKGFVAGRVEPPTEAERAESARAAYQSNAVWLGSELTDFLMGGSDSKVAAR